MKSLFKRSISVILAVIIAVSIMAIVPVSAGAESIIDSGTWSFTTTSNTFIGEGEWSLNSDYTLTISSTSVKKDSNGYNTAGNAGTENNYLPWAKYKSSIKKVIFQGTVNRVGFKSFYSYDALEEIEFNDQMKAIMNYAFYDCDSLKNVVFTDNIIFIGEQSFCSCDSLEEITLPKALNSSKGWEFKDCINLKTIYIPDFEDDCSSLGFKETFLNCSINDIYYYGTPGSSGINSLLKDGKGLKDNRGTILHVVSDYYEDFLDYQSSYYKTVTITGDITDYPDAKLKVRFINYNNQYQTQYVNKGGKVNAPIAANYSSRHADNYNSYTYMGFTPNPDIPITENTDYYATYSATSKYTNPEWTWSDDYKTATATFKLKGNNTQTKTVEAGSDDITATIEDGKIKYTASVIFPTDDMRDENEIDQYSTQKTYSDKTEVNIPEDTPQVLGTTASLDGVIHLNFYVTIGNYPLEQVTCYIKNTDNDESYESDVPLVKVADDNYYKASVDVLPKEMSDDFKITLSYGEYQEETTIPVIMSIKSYMNALIENNKNNTSKTDLVKLCKATLNYGAAAQIQFGYRTDDLPNAEINYSVPDVDMNSLRIDNGSYANYSNLGMNYYASSLGLFSDTSYAICFEMDETASYYNINANITNSEESLERETVGVSKWTDDENVHTADLVAFYIPSIAAKDLLKDISVTFTDTETNESLTTSFNIQTYIYKVLKDTGVNPEYHDGSLDDDTNIDDISYQKSKLSDTVKAIYDYAKKADAYFD